MLEHTVLLKMSDTVLEMYTVLGNLRSTAMRQQCVLSKVEVVHLNMPFGLGMLMRHSVCCKGVSLNYGC